MRELGAAPERTLMVGDTTHDLQLAANAGCASVAVSFGAHEHDEFARHRAAARRPLDRRARALARRACLTPSRRAPLPSAARCRRSACAPAPSWSRRAARSLFDVLHFREPARAFALRFDGRVVAYLNRCVARADRARLAARRVSRRRPRVHHLLDPRRQLRARRRPLHRRPVRPRAAARDRRPWSATARSGGCRRATRGRRSPTDGARLRYGLRPSRARAMLVRPTALAWCADAPATPRSAMAQALRTQACRRTARSPCRSARHPRNPGGLLP